MASWKSIGQEGNQNCHTEVCFLIPTWWVFLSSIWRVSSNVPNTRDGRQPLRITKTIFTSLATCRTLFTYYSTVIGREIRTVYTRGLLLELISRGHHPTSLECRALPQPSTRVENLCMRPSERVTSDWETTATLFAVCLFGDPDHPR